MKQISANITGSLIINGTDVTNVTISSSAWSGSFSTRVSNLESFSGSINSYTASNNTNISNLNATTSSLNLYTGSNNTNISNLNATSASLNLASGSAITRLNAIEVVTGSNISRLNSIESTTGSLNTASGSAITRLNALEVTSGSNITRINALESASGSAITRLNSIESTTGSLNAASGSAITRLNALEVTSGSNISRLSSLESKTGSYATTGSNTFVNTQYISASNNPVGFTTTASLYTDGGLRVTRDAYISGTLYLNNVTVYGTQSIAYISSSQLNIASNLITVNTATPSVQFGGLAVYDSGSTGLTGSILWDSTNNRWIYSNPSGSTYDGGMLISGPRNSSGLGNEIGTTACALMMGQGGDHITSSAITHYSTATCFYGNAYISSTGNACIAGTITSNVSTTSTDCSTLNLVSGCVGIGGINPSNPLHIYTNVNGASTAVKLHNGSACAGATTGIEFELLSDYCDYKKAEIRAVAASQYANNIDLAFWSGGSTVDRHAERMRIFSTGETCFACTVCALSFSQTAGTWFQGGSVNIISSDGSSNYINTGTKLYIQSAGTNLGAVTNTGNVGIGNTSPSYKLDISLPTTCTAVVARFNSPSYDEVHISAGLSNYIGTNSTSAFSLRTTNTNRLTIAGTGEACFACQVCAPAFVGGTVSGTTGTFTGQLCTPSSLVLGTNNAYALYLRDSTGTAKPVMATAGGTNLNFYNVCSTGAIIINNAADTGAIVKIDNIGIGCFAGRVCAANLSTDGVAMRYADFSNYSFQIGTDTSAGGWYVYQPAGYRFTIKDGGIAVFACRVCSPSLTTGILRLSDEATYGLTICKGSSSYPVIFADGAQSIGFITAQSGVSYGERLRIFHTGETCFACQICSTNGFRTGDNSYLTKSSIRLRSANDGNYLDIQSTNTCNIISSNYGTADTPIIIGTYNGYQANQLFLATNCNIGIGTNGPVNKIHIENGGMFFQASNIDTDGIHQPLTWNPQTSNLKNTIIGTVSTDYLSVDPANGSLAIRIGGSGGLYGGDPGFMNAGMQVLIYANGGDGALGGGYIQFLTKTNATSYSCNGSVRLTINPDGIATFCCNVCTTKYLTVGAQGGSDVVFLGGGSGVGATIEARYADGNPNVHLAGNGNSWLNRTYGSVGIGTCSPAYLLDVSGATRTGTLLVSNNTTTTWCVGRIDNARANTWYTIYTWPGIYDGAFALAQLGYEDNNGDGANAHALWMTTGPAYSTGFGVSQIGGATNLCLQRSGQSLQALITGVTDRTGGAYLGFTVQTMNVAS